MVLRGDLSAICVACRLIDAMAFALSAAVSFRQIINPIMTYVFVGSDR